MNVTVSPDRVVEIITPDGQIVPLDCSNMMLDSGDTVEIHFNGQSWKIIVPCKQAGPIASLPEISMTEYIIENRS